MNKIAVTLVISIAVGIAIFTYTGNNEQGLDIESIVREPQQDTSIDFTSERDTFEYFLSGLEDKNIENLQAQFHEFNSLNSETEQIDKALFQQYINYKIYLQALSSDTHSETFGFEELTRLNDQLLAAQIKFFSVEQQRVLFGDENQLRTLALKKLELKQLASSEEEFDVLWQQELQQLPEVEQRAYKSAALMGSLATAQGLDMQDQYLMRQALVGADGAQRLAELDDRVEAFNADINDYLAKRQELIADKSLAAEDIELAITDLRNASFSSEQLRRIKALERIHDRNSSE